MHNCSDASAWNWTRGKGPRGQVLVCTINCFIISCVPQYNDCPLSLPLTRLMLWIDLIQPPWYSPTSLKKLVKNPFNVAQPHPTQQLLTRVQGTCHSTQILRTLIFSFMSILMSFSDGERPANKHEITLRCHHAALVFRRLELWQPDTLLSAGLLFRYFPKVTVLGRGLFVNHGHPGH